MKVCRRGGFSRAELLLTLAILVTAGGLIWPAVARVQEAAQLSACHNNLRQLTLALHNYAGCFDGRLPSNPDTPDGRAGTLQYHLLPYLE
jgi:hypothetical protein